VTAVITHDGTCAGAVGPFPVDVPWWADVEPVVTHLEQVLGGPAVVLRLLSVEGSDGMRDGHVTYHAEALTPPPGDLAPCDFADDDHPLRLPWARAAGLRDLLGWAAGHVDLTGRPAQRKTWNLSCLFRLPAASGPVWLKAIPPFAAAEPVAIAAFAEVDPGLVPATPANQPRRTSSVVFRWLPALSAAGPAPGAVLGSRVAQVNSADVGGHVESDQWQPGHRRVEP
jgi:hypothetical protein